MTTPTIQTLDVVAVNGTPFRVLFIPPGVPGPNAFRTPADSPHATVEFYDRRHNFTPEVGGQFTGGSYYASTLVGRNPNSALWLNGSQEAWSLDAATMTLVTDWVSRNLLTFGGHYEPATLNFPLSL